MNVLLKMIRNAMVYEEDLARRAVEPFLHGERTGMGGLHPSLTLYVRNWTPTRTLDLAMRDRRLLDDFEAMGQSPEVAADAWTVLRDHVLLAAEFWLTKYQVAAWRDGRICPDCALPFVEDEHHRDKRHDHCGPLPHTGPIGGPFCERCG